MPYDFDAELAVGDIGESFVADLLDATLHPYETHPHLQRAGIDLSDDNNRIDVKTQAWKYIFTGNMPIELFSVYEEAQPGWFFKSEADLIVWLYLDETGDSIYSKGYIMPMHDEIVQWVKEHRELWRKVEVNNDGRYGSYTAVNYLIPVPAFPAEFLIPFDTGRDNPSHMV